MEFRQLKYFHVAAKLLHFGHAAAQLHIDQSSVSKSIKALEENLGTKLFHRAGTRVSLTKEGSIYFEETKHIINSLENAKIKALTGDSCRNKLRLTVPYCIDVRRLSELLRYYRQEYPDININVIQTDDADMFDGLKSGRYDLGLSYSHETKYDIHQSEIWDDHLVFLLPKRHPLVELPIIPISELSAYTLICFNRCSAIQQQVFSLLKELRIVLKSVEYAKSYDLLLALVSAGFGIGLLTESVFKNMKNENIVSRQIKEGYTLTTYVYSLYYSERVEQFNRIIQRLA